MLTFPVTRRQHNAILQPRVQLHAGDEPPVTRQEFKDEADINYILGRFGVQAMRPATFGDYDYDIDLQTALDAIEKAEQGYYRLPPAIRDKYPNWQSVIMALADGTKASEVREVIKTLLSDKEPQNATRSSAEGGSEGSSGQPATGERRGAVPDGNDQGTP